MYVHSTDPHAPYLPRSPFKEQFAPDIDPTIGLHPAVVALTQGRAVAGPGVRQGLIDLYMLREDLFLGVLDGVTPEWFEQRYRMFLMLDDIEVEAFDGEPWLLSLQGPEAEQVLSTLRLPIP